ETFGARGEELYFKARGLPCGAADRLRELDVEHGRPGGSWGETSDTKEIHRTTSLADATADPAQLRAMLAYLVDRAAKALRDRGRVTGRLDVVLGLASGGPSELEARERPRRSPVSLERGVAIAPPSATTRLLVARANALVESLLDEHRCLVRLIGVRLGRLCIAARGHQQRFFFGEVDDQEDMRGQRIDAALDRLRERHGFAAVIAGEANALRGSLALGRDGFKLRTPSLTL
nr:hypothetical protein [Planctomycetota bacterium]